MRNTVVIVGAGPRGTGILERIAANAPAGQAGWDFATGTPLDIHLVDPYPPGGGRIWRQDQSPLLWMNSQAEDVTMFGDESVRLAGPLHTGPTLHEWAGIAGRTFADRRLQGGYLNWVYEKSLAALPSGITVHYHPRRALRVTGPRKGRQQVWLDGSAQPLSADLVVLALGHLDAALDEEQRALADHARRHGLTYLPPDYTADSDLTALAPGEPVLVRGFGQAFVDLMVLLGEGRGGRFEKQGGDPAELTYRPSGREPVLYVGSRRGVPYHSKIGYALAGERPPLPRFFGPAEVAALLARRGQPSEAGGSGGGLDFRRDVWPLVAKELGFAHYHRLFTAHPERTRAGWTWAAFEKAYAEANPYGPDLGVLAAVAVPAPADRLDLAALDRPLAGVRYAALPAFQERLRSHVRADLARRHHPAHDADLAVFFALLSVYGQLVRLGDIGTWWHGFFSFMASGPPGPRLRQLLALSRAGLVRFLGAGMTVTARPGAYAATSRTVPCSVTARALVEARLPDPAGNRVRDPLLARLYADGAAATPAGLLAVDPDDFRVLDRTGRAHPRRFALGPYTDARGAATFSRPRTDSPVIRQNDAVARAVLGFLRDQGCPAAA